MMRRKDARSFPRAMLTKSVKTGIVVPSSVALTAVVSDKPFTNSH